MTAESGRGGDGPPGSRSTDRGSRASRQGARPSPRITPKSLVWQVTRAPRPRLTDPHHDPIRPNLLIGIGVLAGFGQAARDFAQGGPGLVLLRGVFALIGAVLLVAFAVTYLRRPPTSSKPSLIAKARIHRRKRR